MNPRCIIDRGEAEKAGTKTYFTGKECCNGHVSERRTDRGVCVECRNEKRREKSALARATRVVLRRELLPCRNGHGVDRNRQGRCRVCKREDSRKRDGITSEIVKQRAEARAAWVDARANGKVRYYTEIPCRNGHIGEHYTNGMSCCECMKIRLRTDAAKKQREIYRAANKEKVLLRERAGRTKNRDAIAARHTAWRAANKEHVRQCGRVNAAARRADNPEESRAANRRWRKANPEKVKARDAAWRAANPEIRAANERNRNARKREAGGSHTAADVAGIMRLQKHRCAMPTCRVSLKKKRYHVDHIIPLSRGGSNDRRNLQVLCAPCNIRKHDHDPLAYARRIGMLL